MVRLRIVRLHLQRQVTDFGEMDLTRSGLLLYFMVVICCKDAAKSTIFETCSHLEMITLEMIND